MMCVYMCVCMCVHTHMYASVNRETTFPDIKKLIFWQYETEKTFNDCSNVLMLMKDQVKDAG